jgi:metal-responsive CopG/Arc/MetJ family transcriptional regulator
VKSQNVSAVRASISFPPELYEALEEVAKQKKVSLAWVVRDATERYVAAEKPTGRGQKQG